MVDLDLCGGIEGRLREGEPCVEDAACTDCLRITFPSAMGAIDLALAIHLRSNGLLTDLPVYVARELAVNPSADERVVHADEQSFRVQVSLALHCAEDDR